MFVCMLTWLGSVFVCVLSRPCHFYYSFFKDSQLSLFWQAVQKYFGRFFALARTQFSFFYSDCVLVHRSLLSKISKKDG